MQKIIHYRCDICETNYCLEDVATRCEELHILTDKLIEEFINKIKIQYIHIKIQYEYDKYDNEYYIYHNNYELEDDINFVNYAGKLLREIFRNNNIWNTNFSYRSPD